MRLLIKRVQLGPWWVYSLTAGLMRLEYQRDVRRDSIKSKSYCIGINQLNRLDRSNCMVPISIYFRTLMSLYFRALTWLSYFMT